MRDWAKKLSSGLALVVGAGVTGPGLVTSAGCNKKNECPVCQEEKCADLVKLCDPDPDCACMSDCLGENGVPGVQGCLSTCGITERPLAFYAVEECVATACPDEEDECATPAGYTPPEPDLPPGDTGAAGLGGGDLADCGFDPDLVFDPEGTVLQLASEDGVVCVRLERSIDGAGSLANNSYTLLAMQVGPAGSVALVEDPGALCYYSSHHNFMDYAHVWTGATHHDLKIEEDGHGGPRTYALMTHTQGPLSGDTCAPTTDGTGELIGGGPIELFPVNP